MRHNNQEVYSSYARSPGKLTYSISAHRQGSRAEIAEEIWRWQTWADMCGPVKIDGFSPNLVKKHNSGDGELWPVTGHTIRLVSLGHKCFGDMLHFVSR